MSRLLVALLLTFLTTLGGCNSGKKTSADKDAEAATKDRGTIGYSALTTTNPFFVIIGDTMEAEAKKQGYDMIRVSGDRDAKKQSNQIDEFIAKGVAAIVMNPCDSKGVGEAIKRANEAGIPVFTNDIKYDGDVGEVVSHVATDNYQGGKLAGKAMVDAIGKTGGEVAILGFPQVESCQLRVKGFNEVLDEHNSKEGNAQIKVVKTLDGGGLRKEGYNAATASLEAHDQLKAIFAINDPSALGAYSAIKDAGKTDQVVIIGFDGEKNGKQAILEGKILCDPIQFPDEIARKTIAEMMKYFNGDEVEKEILIPSKLYYKKDAQSDPVLKQ
jgi:ribose transport system substrate-binding protein